MQPKVHTSQTHFLTMMMEEETDHGTGIPFGQWMTLAGSPGTGKTTMALNIAAGFKDNTDVEIDHYDYEMTEYRVDKIYKALEIDLGRINYHYELHRDTPMELLKHIEARARSLSETGKSLLAIVDSSDFLYARTDYNQQAVVARELRSIRSRNPNLLLLLIGHLNSQGKLAGAMELQRYNDTLFFLQKKNGYVYLSAPKCRHPAPNAPEEIKLYMDGKTRRFELSNEPDWISEMPAVQFAKRMTGKLFRGKKNDA